MGLLRKKHHQPVLGTRNPTGIPSATREQDQPLSDASKLAAQAAASLAHSQQHQQPSQLETTSVPKRPPLPQKRLSRHIVPSTSSRSIMSQKRSSYISTSPELSRSAAQASSNNYDLSVENLSLNHHDDCSPSLHSMSNSMAVASLAAQSAALNSTEFLAPPSSFQKPFHSSPSSRTSSTHSFTDSPPFYAKVGELPPSADFFAALNRSNSAVSDSDQREFDEFEWVNRSSSSVKSTTSSHAKPPSRQNSIPLTLRGTVIPHNPVVDEVIEEHEEPDVDDEPYADRTTDGNTDDRGRKSTQQRPALRLESPPKLQAPKAGPQRKPPPMSPPLTPSHEYLSTPPQMVRRASSPRRKPPPDYVADDNDEKYDDSTLYSDDEVLPQYPLTTDTESGHHHHHRKYTRRPHGLRKGAKKILQKGFKGSSYAPSTFLEPEAEQVTQQKPVQLKTTMRKEKKKSKFNEDKPWKHHTDTAFVTDQERKRYEGVWVSNAGLYMDRVDTSTLLRDVEVPGEINTALKASMMSMKAPIGAMEANLMVNVVAREIWARSKLPRETLMKVWDLVDTRHDGTLDRTSFILGMWLVDQCLYGRKLPKEVPDAVWNSVTHNGLNVVIKKKHKKSK